VKLLKHAECARNREVLINDKLTEELCIILIATGSGKWKFADDPPEKIRLSEKPQH